MKRREEERRYMYSKADEEQRKRFTTSIYRKSWFL